MSSWKDYLIDTHPSPESISLINEKGIKPSVSEFPEMKAVDEKLKKDLHLMVPLINLDLKTEEKDSEKAKEKLEKFFGKFGALEVVKVEMKDKKMKASILFKRQLSAMIGFKSVQNMLNEIQKKPKNPSIGISLYSSGKKPKEDQLENEKEDLKEDSKDHPSKIKEDEGKSLRSQSLKEEEMDSKDAEKMMGNLLKDMEEESNTSCPSKTKSKDSKDEDLLSQMTGVTLSNQSGKELSKEEINVLEKEASLNSFQRFPGAPLLPPLYKSNLNSDSNLINEIFTLPKNNLPQNQSIRFVNNYIPVPVFQPIYLPFPSPPNVNLNRPVITKNKYGPNFQMNQFNFGLPNYQSLMKEFASPDYEPFQRRIKNKPGKSYSFKTRNGRDYEIKYVSEFEVQIEDDSNFRVVRRIIGSHGQNLKRILYDTCVSKGDYSTRIRLRGRGSGYKEGEQQVEANIPLMLCISSLNLQTYLECNSAVERLLTKIYFDYLRFITLNKLKPEKIPKEIKRKSYSIKRKNEAEKEEENNTPSFDEDSKNEYEI